MKQHVKYLFVGGLSVLVLLALLLVLMVVTPLLTVGTAVELPKIEANSKAIKPELVTIFLNGDSVIFVQDEEVLLDDLVVHFVKVHGSDYQQKIYLRGDRDTDYGEVMKVMGRLSSAGFTNISLITEPDQNK